MEYFHQFLFEGFPKSLGLFSAEECWQVEMVEWETQVLVQMAANDEGLKHPVCEAFIHLKDARFGGKLSLLLYTFFILSLTTLVMADHSRWMRQIYSPH